MADQSIEDTLRMQLMRMGALMAGMRHFSVVIIAHVLNGGNLDAHGFDEIQKATIRGLKGSTTEGLTVPQQAELFRTSQDAIRTLMAGAIAEGTKRQLH